MILITSARFEEHTPPPGHPERPERAHVFDAVAARWRERGGRTISPRAATSAEILRVHDPAYLEALAGTAGRAVMLDPDTFTSAATYDTALLAAGAAVQAVEHAIDTREPAFALVRPPGHHADRDRAMGFCFLNNVAIGAAAALARGGQRVAIVDIDVHHGNGTQSIFYADPRVLYVSTHQHPFYPGTGAADEVGEGDGKGFTINAPLEAGATDADYDLVCRRIVAPVLQQFSPQVLIVSAGYDAHERDPLGSMRVTSGGYAATVHAIATATGNVPAAFLTEGGYELSALAECLEASFAAIDAATPGADLQTSTHCGSPLRGQRAVQAVGAAHYGFWGRL
jgi:acetoin utilization deacetylase AcuC-like enzyme